MAEVPSGYDEDFVNPVEDEVLCLICHLPLKEPVQTRCGHRFCKECLEEHFIRCVLYGILAYINTVVWIKCNFTSLAAERQLPTINDHKTSV